MGIGAADRRRAHGVLRDLRGSQRDQRHRLSSPSRPPIRPRSATASKPRARQCARGAHRADRARCGTPSTARGWSCKRYGNGPTSRERTRELPALGAGNLAALRRLGLPHHAAQRRLLVLAARRLHLERADNTARILDVKYHLLLPDDEHVGGPLDYFQWAAILRSVSALTAYHWVYRESLKPWLIADLLILNDQMPRSLATCYEAIWSAISTQIGVRLWPPGPGAAPRPRRPHPPAEHATWRRFSSTACMNSSRNSLQTTTVWATSSPSNTLIYERLTVGVPAHLQIGHVCRCACVSPTRRTYRYEPPATGVIQMLRLTPRNHDGQYVAELAIDVSTDLRARPA